MQISIQQFLNNEALSYMDASAQHERKMNVASIRKDWRLRETDVLTLIKISFRNKNVGAFDKQPYTFRGIFFEHASYCLQSTIRENW